jgi:hypothetical protein
MTNAFTKSRRLICSRLMNELKDSEYVYVHQTPVNIMVSAKAWRPGGVSVLLANPRWEKRLLRF